jgi:cysteine sulfinate desulfinase/cysteine desulfurase-like protein
MRFSLGHGNTAQQVDALVDALGASMAHLRRISPVEQAAAPQAKGPVHA